MKAAPASSNTTPSGIERPLDRDHEFDDVQTHAFL
jgi:hypothetical protein